jgi:hypothetical protein
MSLWQRIQEANQHLSVFVHYVTLPSGKKYVVCVFAHWAEVICNKKSPCWNLPIVEVLLWQWPQHQMSCCQLTSAKSWTITRQFTMASIFSITQNTLGKISKAISKNYIETVCTAPRKICGCVNPMTLKTPRCGKMYVAQICHSIRTRVNEHHHHIWL